MGWLSAIGTGMEIAGSAFGLYSSYEASLSAKAQGKKQATATMVTAGDNARISRYDATVAEEDAAATEYRTRILVSLKQREIDQVLGTQKARLGKSGVSVGSGSGLNLTRQTERDGQADIDLIRYNGQTAADAKRSLAERYRMLAAAGLRDAAYTAGLIEDASADRSTGYLIQGAESALKSGYQIGRDQGWW